MPQLIISSEADQDLLDIWLYIAQDSPVNADRFLDRLYEVAHKLTEFNEMGTARPDLAEALRSFPVDRYVIYFRPIQQGIELVRVLRGSRDITVLF